MTALDPLTAEASGSISVSRLRRSRHWVGAALPVGIVILWQIVSMSGAVNPLFMPSPADVGSSFVEVISSGQLANDMAISLWRAVQGFVIGGGSGVVAGIVLGLVPWAGKLLDPTLQLIRLTPTLAIAPLLVLWFGFDETSKVVLIATIAFFPLYLSALQGIRHVDAQLREVAAVLGFSWTDRARLLTVPSSLPYLFNGLRLSLAGSWLGLIVAELTGADNGIGHLILAGQTQSRTDQVFVGIIVFAEMGWAIDRSVRAVEQRALHWRTADSR